MASSVAKLFGTAQNLAAAGQPGLALALYGDFVARYPDEPLLHAVHFNCGVVFSQAGDLDGAVRSFHEAIRLRPDFLPPHINLGSVYERLGVTEPALAHWAHAIAALSAVTGDALSHKVTALKQTARVLEDRKRLAEAEDALRQLIELNPRQRDAVQHWISLRQRQCRWPALVPVGELSPRSLKRAMAPLSLANSVDDPVLLLANAWAYSREDVGYPTELPEEASGADRQLERRLRVGYLSSDLREHAIGFLTAEMFGLHDRARFEVFVYYCGIQAEDPTKARIRDSVEHWRDIASLDDATAHALINADGLDVLVDVNGHTRGSRTMLLSLRPAPAIVNWLGFPGSMGTPYHHYIVADAFIIPESSERFYSERVLRLPCYQPTDRQRRVAERASSRAEAGLPEAATVFCTFNGTQKITEAVFGRWMTILHDVPGSVLWLLKGAEEVDVRLRSRAEEAGIAPERLIFAPMLNNRDHLARYALADLFLDTMPYGAHTTASDSLWMGLPVLTLPGQSFASRVCGSLVRAAGVPELVCESAEDYVARAVALGRDRDALAAYRARLLKMRHGSVLFDTSGFTRGMEDLLERIREDLRAGQLPRPDLTNLDTYLEIGVTLEHDAGSPADAAENAVRYRRALARRHAFSPLPPDGRYWPGPDAPLGAAPVGNAP